LTRLPEAVSSAIAQLEYTTVHVDYRPNDLPSPAHWIYEPDESVSHHRQLLRHNFVAGARGHWVETNARRAGVPEVARFVNEYAYPVSTVGRAAALTTIVDWARTQGVLPLGRWGTWEHINSDVAVERGLAAAKQSLENPR